MARKKQPKQKPEGGVIRMGPIVWDEPQPAQPQKGGVIIMGPIKPEGGDK